MIVMLIELIDLSQDLHAALALAKRRPTCPHGRKTGLSRK